jgi:hypothetical protein
MNIAIMQPYFLPYIGYFQLINAVDKFIFYDDVQYMKGGWINRNRLLANGQVAYFNVEMSGASANKKINEVEISRNLKWKKKLIKTISQAYSKAPNFKNVILLIEGIIMFKTKNGLLSEYVINSITAVCDYLDISTEIGLTSSVYDNSILSGQGRVLDICSKEKSSSYVNPIGGLELYSQEAFNNCGLKLRFIETVSEKYSQGNLEFVPSLSILDVMMHNSKSEIKTMLDEYELI